MLNDLVNAALKTASTWMARAFPVAPAANPFSLAPSVSTGRPAAEKHVEDNAILELFFRMAMRCPRKPIFAGLASLLSSSWVAAQSVTDSFMTNSAPGWVFGGTGYTPNLTSGGDDLAGQGWLRMTDNTGNLATYAYYNTPVDSRDTTIFSSFEFAHWDDGAGGAADGMTFFLFDGSQTFAVGANGGSMGYAQKTGTDGLAGGYMGLALDDWGNYSNPTEGRVGGPGFIPNAIAVRGPGTGQTGYEYIAGTEYNGTPALNDQLDFPTATLRPTATADYRKVSITLSPGNQLSVSIQFGTNAPQSIYIADLSGYTRPETLKFGFTSGTGGAMSYHELRNFTISSVKAMLWDNNSGNSLWGTATNWFPNNLPVAGADILFNNAYVSTAQNVNLGGVTREVRTVTLDSPLSYTLSNGTLGFTNSAPGTLTLAASSIYGDAAHTVSANITTTDALLIKNTTTSTLTLSGNIDNNGHRINFDGAAPIVASGIISDTGSLYKYGTNSLVLSGANTYSGGTVLNAGAIGIGNSQALGTNSLTINGDTASLYASGGAFTITNAVSLRSDLTIGGSQNFTMGGTITNYGGDNRITVTNSGTTTISGNVLLSESNTARTLTVDGAGDATVSGVISNGGTGAGNLTKDGSGTLTLSGANTYTGNTTINAGTLALGANNVLSDSTDVALMGGTLLLNAKSDRVDLFTFGNSTLDYGTTGSANYFMFTDEGATPTGTLTVLNWETGTDRLAYRSTSAIPSAGFLDNIYFSGYGAGGEVLAANQDKSISGYGGATDWDFITPKTAAWSVWDGGDGSDSRWDRDANWVGDAKPSSGTTLRVSFAGTTRTNPVMQADYTMNSLLFTNGAASFKLTSSSGTREIRFDGTLPSLMQKSDNGQEINSAIYLNQTTIVDTIGAGELLLSGIVSQSGGINKYGTGADLILSGANTYSGATVINQGAINIRNNTALGSTAAGTTVATDAALEIQNNITVTGEALTLSGTGQSDAGALRNISGNNTWTGAVTLGTDSRINSDSGTLTVSGAIDGSGKDLTVGGAGNVTLSGVIGTGAGSLTKDGAGTLTLSGTADNTFSGGFFLNAGSVDLNKTAGVDALSGAINIGDGSGTDTLRLLAANQIDDSAIVDFASSGVLNLNNNNETIAGINATSSSAAIQLGNGTLTINSFANSSFAGVISDGAGTGALTKTGANTLTLTGANTYDGTTTVSQGVLNIRNATALGSATGGTTVATGATLQVQDSITVTGEALTLNGTGVAGTGALRNTIGNNTWTGAVTLGAAATVASDSGTLTISGTVNNAGNTLTVGGDGNTTLSGVVSGAGGLTKTDDGTLTLSAANTFTGNITITGGTLLLGGDNRIPNSVDMTLNGGTFATGGYDETLDTLTLSANSTINLGSGSSILNFSDSSAMSWSSSALYIASWSGSVTGGGTDQIFFGTSGSGLTMGQIGKIYFVDPFGPGTGTYPAGILSTGEIVPVPEPATVACVALIFLVVGWRERERLAGFFRQIRA